MVNLLIRGVISITRVQNSQYINHLLMRNYSLKVMETCKILNNLFNNLNKFLNTSKWLKNFKNSKIMMIRLNSLNFLFWKKVFFLTIMTFPLNNNWSLTKKIEKLIIMNCLVAVINPLNQTLKINIISFVRHIS